MNDLQNLITLIKKVETWAEERNFYENATPTGQVGKTVEEAQELEDAILSLKRADTNEEWVDSMEHVLDGVGDTLVTLIILCMILDIHIEDTLQMAYNEIKDRKGQWSDGIFIKEEDLELPF